jgi:hypothetical protein
MHRAVLLILLHSAETVRRRPSETVLESNRATTLFPARRQHNAALDR